MTSRVCKTEDGVMVSAAEWLVIAEGTALRNANASESYEAYRNEQRLLAANLRAVRQIIERHERNEEY